MGSLLLSDWIPEADSLTVARIRAAGAIGLGKTNVPEFGAGSQTYNRVFGTTRNPYDPTRTPGGSSGGAAAALAAGLIALADGSDYGGSLRNPASFCNVVGFRPTPGRVPSWPDDDPWDPMSVDGPLGRTVGDVALLLSVMAGPDLRAAMSLEAPGSDFRDPRGSVDGLRIALAPRFAGLPMDPRIPAVVEAAGAVLEGLGCDVVLAEPDLRGADEAFLAPRHAAFRATVLAHVGDDPGRLDLVKPELRLHVEAGATLTADDLQKAVARRAELRARFVGFMETHDALVLPVSQVLPFEADRPWVAEIDGQVMGSYLDWMRSCWIISLFGAPAISVPAGFVDGLPVGLQIVGRPRADLAVLRLAAAFEEAAGDLWRRHPAMALEA